jgi:hypothetical protein
MGWVALSWLGALAKGTAGAFGGAAQGAASAYPGILQNQQQTAERADLSAFRGQQLADTQQYRADSLAQGADADKWQRAHQASQLKQQRYRDETERMRTESAINRDLMATRGDATREEYQARVRRAERTAARAQPNMSIDQLDRIARLDGWHDYGQVTGVLSSGGQQMPLPGMGTNPGEGGLDTINRMRGQPGFTSFSDRHNTVQDVQDDMSMDDPYYGEVRRALGRP